MRKSKEEKRQIALDVLQMSFREVSKKHGVSLCMIHKNFRKHLFSFFDKSEVLDSDGNIKDIEELREIFNKYRIPVAALEINKLTENERVIKNVKLLKSYKKSSTEIVKHFNILGVKFQGKYLTVEDVINI
jgi:hypothetical protein